MKQRQRIRKKAPEGAFSHGAPIPAGHKGGKGGGGGRTPVEVRDSLHSTAYARVIDLLGEGEIYGPVHGMDNALRDVYLNGTPVANADGTLNFSGAAIDFRTGTQLQEPLPGFPAAENTIAVGAELKAAQHWTRLFANLQASAIRVTLGVEGLSKANTGNGDINGYRVEYAIDLSVDGAGYQEVLSSAFDGKTTQRYMRSHRIELPRARQGWSIRLRRITPNANSNTIADRTFIDSVTEVIDAKLRYPMSAVVGIKINASQFQSIPTRAYHVRGRIIRVPANYDPELRSYSGVWDGTFKLAWTNNPAWVFHDLISNDRYGLGTRVPAGWLDKWGLYQIGRYCDEMVDDGFGGKEPRFTCNVYLQQAADAYRVVQDFASIFRGMAYWANASVFAAADMPSDPVYTYSSANVVDGKFSYVGSALGTRYTVALVSWNDLSEMGRQKVEYVENREGIARYGIQQVEVTGFGCTSRGQAHRVGKWMLLTSNLETRSVTFSVGLDACRVRPGSIIRVADQHLAGRRIGGRIREATTTVVTVDAELGVRPGDRLTVNLPSGVSETRVVAAAVGTGLTADNTEFTVDTTELTADLVGLPGSVLHITVTAPFSQGAAGRVRVDAGVRGAVGADLPRACRQAQGRAGGRDLRHPARARQVRQRGLRHPAGSQAHHGRAAVGAGRAAEHPAGLALGHRPGHRAPRGRDLMGGRAVRRGLPRAMAPRQFRLGRGRSHRLADAGTARHPRRRLRGAGARHQRRRRVLGLGQLDRDPAPGRPGAAAGVGPAGHTIAGVRHWLALGISGRTLHRAAHRDLVRPDQ